MPNCGNQNHIVKTKSTMNDPGTQHTEIESFKTFFQGWLTRQADFLQQLFHIQTQLISDQGNVNVNVQAKKLIARVMAHYNQYYEAKFRIAHLNVFLVFSPPWLTPYERMFLWIAGFKPSLMFRIVTSAGVELTPEQAGTMEVVVAEITCDEQRLAEQLCSAEQELTGPSILALARMGGREGNGMVNDVEVELDRLMSVMEALVARADYLREKTVAKVLEILDAGQTVRFLTGVARFQLSVRLWGTQRDAPIRA